MSTRTCPSPREPVQASPRTLLTISVGASHRCRSQSRTRITCPKRLASVVCCGEYGAAACEHAGQGRLQKVSVTKPDIEGIETQPTRSSGQMVTWCYKARPDIEGIETAVAELGAAEVELRYKARPDIEGIETCCCPEAAFLARVTKPGPTSRA